MKDHYKVMDHITSLFTFKNLSFGNINIRETIISHFYIIFNYYQGLKLFYFLLSSSFGHTFPFENINLRKSLNL